MKRIILLTLIAVTVSIVGCQSELFQAKKLEDGTKLFVRPKTFDEGLYKAGDTVNVFFLEISDMGDKCILLKKVR